MRSVQDDNGIYYFIGNTTSHALHALPLYEKLGGTFVTLSNKATRVLTSAYGVRTINIDDLPYKWQRFGWKFKPVHEYDSIGSEANNTFRFLNRKAKVVLFYDIFAFTGSERLIDPKKLFLTHGNMLKDYMGSNNRIQRFEQYDYMAAIGPNLKSKLVNTYKIPNNKLLDLGIARTDELVQYAGQILVPDSIQETLNLDPSRPIVAYLPTFWGTSSIYKTGLEILRNFPDSHTLLFRPHPQTPKKYLKQYIKYINTTNKSIVYVPEGRYESIGLVDILKMSSVIIGDLSSVMLDAILIRKPLIFAYGTNKRLQHSEYGPIEDIVKLSQSIDIYYSSITPEIINKAIENGIDDTAWDNAIRDLFFFGDGTSIDAIEKTVRNLVKTL